MKNLLLIALILLPFYGMSQTSKPIDSFLGVKFGSSRAITIKALKSQGLKLQKSNRGDTSNIVFSNFKLGNEKGGLASIEFVNGQFYMAQCGFTVESKEKVFEIYNNLISAINADYGSGMTKNEVTPDNLDVKGKELMWLELGHLVYNTIWVDDQPNSILLSIKKDMAVRVRYMDTQLATVAKNQGSFASEF